jgi:hypothetical protein
MDEAAVRQYLLDTFAGVDATEAYGYLFFFYDPDGKLPIERKFPFATMAHADDDYDRASNLNRPGVFRLNLGVAKETYRRLFGPPPAAPGPSGVVATGHDFTALDQLLPHPVYAPQSWICILSPTDETFRTTVAPLVAEAYDEAVRKYAK